MINRRNFITSCAAAIATPLVGPLPEAAIPFDALPYEKLHRLWQYGIISDQTFFTTLAKALEEPLIMPLYIDGK